ncbi:MAG TPA: nitronate monooxygenase [Microscillaceae bacterium]|jgi:enoyl-[acyl-carrier protein] reductase II|nr:nitronate monooxygenase [Microscillaceae bacterium]
MKLPSQSKQLCDLFQIHYPIIQAGMVWCSGWRLAAAVSQAGGLGLIGAGSMSPDVLRYHIQQCKQTTSVPFGVNVPLHYAHTPAIIEVLLQERVKIVFTSAGNPSTWTPQLKAAGCTVVHVVSNTKFARKAQEAGVDAVVAEGFEAGGHNGREELTTFCLIPLVCEAVNIPVIAAGGICDGRSMMAAMVLGAAGVQIGTRFAASEESSAHPAFKASIVAAQEDSTQLTLKKLTPVRMLKNPFFDKVQVAEQAGASAEALRDLLGKGRSRKGIFEGNWEEGEWEVGQVAARVGQVLPASKIVHQIWAEWQDMQQLFT